MTLGFWKTTIATTVLMLSAFIPMTAHAQTPTNLTSSSQQVSATPQADLLVGAAASPQRGTGNGNFWIYSLSNGQSTEIPLATGVNSFNIAIDHSLAYVPTLQGTTYIVNIDTKQVVGQFASAMDARFANIAPNENLLILTGMDGVSAYSLTTHQLQWTVPVSGNTLAIAGNKAYVSNNLSTNTTIIDLKNGSISGNIPVGNIENSVYDSYNHTLWLANWYNGDMTVVNTNTQKIIKTIHTPEGDPNLTTLYPYSVSSATAGYMQLAVGPQGRNVYAAGFTGNILVFDATKDTLQRQIYVGGKLSGLAISPNGTEAYTTDEVAQQTDAVSLVTGKLLWSKPGMLANRWFITTN
jgi:DNA-binding beta-propeller fold protein YncE